MEAHALHQLQNELLQFARRQLSSPELEKLLCRQFQFWSRFVSVLARALEQIFDVASHKYAPTALLVARRQLIESVLEQLEQALCLAFRRFGHFGGVSFWTAQRVQIGLEGASVETPVLSRVLETREGVRRV